MPTHFHVFTHLANLRISQCPFPAPMSGCHGICTFLHFSERTNPHEKRRKKEGILSFSRLLLRLLEVAIRTPDISGSGKYLCTYARTWQGLIACPDLCRDQTMPLLIAGINSSSRPTNLWPQLRAQNCLDMIEFIRNFQWSQLGSQEQGIPIQTTGAAKSSVLISMARFQCSHHPLPPPNNGCEKASESAKGERVQKDKFNEISNCYLHRLSRSHRALSSPRHQIRLFWVSTRELRLLNSTRNLGEIGRKLKDLYMDFKDF